MDPTSTLFLLFCVVMKMLHKLPDKTQMSAFAQRILNLQYVIRGIVISLPNLIIAALLGTANEMIGIYFSLFFTSSNLNLHWRELFVLFALNWRKYD